jgi:integrase
MNRIDTPTINFDSVPQVRKAAKNKPDAGTIWYKHEDRKYECLYLGVGKRAATWYFKGRLNGRSQQKSLKITYPTSTAAIAFKKIKALAEMHKDDASADIRTVRDAWLHHCETRKSEGKGSDQHRDTMTTQLERWASNILDADPVNVSTTKIQNAINAIDTGRGANSAATKRHVRVGLLSAFGRLQMQNPVTKVSVPAPNEQQPIWYDICDLHRELDPSDLSNVWEAIWTKWQQNVILGTTWVVMLFTGIRAENVASLRWSPDGEHGFVDLQRQELIFPKLKSGVRNRPLPIGDIVTQALTTIRLSQSEWVFPANTKTGYVGGGHGFDRLRATVMGELTDVIRPKDTRKFFQEACNEAMLPDHVMSYLRGDVTTKGDSKMLMKYTARVGKSAPNMVENAMCELIRTTPYFVLEN